MTLEAGFCIGAREVFPLEGRIAGPKGALRVEPKAMAVLLELARHAPHVRTRQQIVQAVWPRGFVSDDVLTRCIGQLRRALGDDAHAAAHLETIPKRGYRLRAAPGALRHDAPAVRLRQNAESLIVLPFRNLSASNEDFIADGLTELLILRLCALRDVRIISRTTAMRFKASTASVAEIAAGTGADWVIEGSVLQSGDRLQVIAQLIDARTDAHIWAAEYVRDLQDLLPLQNEIALRLAAAIRAQLGAESASPNALPSLPPQVMRDYLRGRHLISQRTLTTLRDASGLFESITAAAPGFAAAWASLAECELMLAHYGAPYQARLVADCERHLEQALTLEPELALGLSARAALRFFFKGDLDGAADDSQHALALLPSHGLAMVSMANVCAVRRHFAEATAWLQQALLVDPLDVGLNMNFGDHMILQRRFDAALDALRRILEIAPQHRPCQLRTCWALALAGQPTEAHALLAGIGPNGTDDVQWLEYAALVAAAVGDPASALAHFRTLERLARKQPVPAWALARAAAAAQRFEAAIDWIETAAQQQSSSMPFVLLTPAFDALHSNPRFSAAARSLPLPRTRRRNRE
jgi:TolB-like protein/predicted Zn-dependent protease